jgi:hypothetical protein
MKKNGRPNKFKVESITKVYVVPLKVVEDLDKFYLKKTKKYLNK